MASEFERIRALSALFGAPASGSGVVCGIGDDAAVLDPSRLAPGAEHAGLQLVWTVDAQVEGVHFRRGLLSWHDVGYRSFMAAASDVAAMGADPWCALSAIALHAAEADQVLTDIARGQAEASAALGTPIVGGNLSRASEVSITTTVLGTAAHAVVRHARAGESLWVAGPLGLAGAGFLALDRGLPEADFAVAIAAWRRPQARVADGRALRGHASGAIDVSDGLAQDVGHLVAAGGVCAVLDAAALLAHGGDELLRNAARLGVAPLDLVLYGGEDYALVAASLDPLPGFTRIGELEPGAGVALHAGEAVEPLAARGFDHFEGPRARR